MKTILLVDHNMKHLLQHNDILSRAGFGVLTAQDGKSALFILESGIVPDLIVTEYATPDMEPGEFLSVIRKHVPFVPAIVVTSCDTVASHIHSISLGVYDYVNKPILPADLIGIVTTAVDARQWTGLPAGQARQGQRRECRA